MGLMCLAESYKIYRSQKNSDVSVFLFFQKTWQKDSNKKESNLEPPKKYFNQFFTSRLYVEERLYTHPLFELARSDTTRVVDRHGATTRFNASERDDPEAPAANPQVQFSEIRAFAGQGRSLNEAGNNQTLGVWSKNDAGLYFQTRYTE